MAITSKKKNKSKIKRSNAKGWVKETDTSWSPTAFKVPKGTKVFKFKEKKTYRLDIMGYKVGVGNPRCPDEGAIHFERTYFVHDNVGPKREKYPCLVQTFGRKKCPICDHVTKLYREGAMEEKLIKKMEPKMRHLWIVRDLEDTESGFQIMETGHYKTFGEQLKDKIDALDDDSAFLDFYMPEEGSSFAIKTKEDTFTDDKGASRNFFAVGNIDIVPRRKQYSEDVLDDLPCLDELLVELSYEDLKAKFMGDDDEEDEDKPKKKGNKKTVEDEDDEDSDDDAPKSKKKKGKAKDEEDDSDDDGDEGDGESGDSDDESEDDEDEESGDSDDEEDAEESEEIEVGDVVSHGKGKKKIEGRVTKIKKGKATVSDDDDEEHILALDELTLVSKAGADEDEEEESDEDEDEKPAKKKSKKKEEPEDDDEGEDDDESDDDSDDDEDEAPKSKKKVKVTGKGKKSKNDEDDEDDDSDDDDEPFEDDDFTFDDDEEEEEAPKSKKKRTG